MFLAGVNSGQIWKTQNGIQSAHGKMSLEYRAKGVNVQTDTQRNDLLTRN